MKTVYLDAPGGSSTWRTRLVLTDDPVSITHTNSKLDALRLLWRTRKRTPRWQRPGLGQLTRWQTLLTALRVIAA